MTLRRASIAAALAVLMLYGGLIVSLAWFLDGATLGKTLMSERTLFSVNLSLLAATMSTALALLLAIPAAYALSRFTFRGKEAVDTVLEFPIIVSPAALGEFGATLMVAGTMAFRTETLPIAIFMRLSSADIKGTVALILVLVSIGLMALFFARRLLRSAAHA
jgi:ABC-type sulfate transport system permease component